MKNILILICYSLSLLLVWGICLMDVGFSNPMSVLVGLGVTVYSLHVVKKSNIYHSTKNAGWYVFLGPLIYLFSAAILIIPLHITIFFKSPILFAFLVFSITYSIPKFSLKTHAAGILFLCYLYSYAVFPQFIKEGEILKNSKELTELVVK
jgi:hypothetical protein